MKKTILLTITLLTLGLMASCSKVPMDAAKATLALEGKMWKVVQVDTLLNNNAIKSNKTDRIRLEGVDASTIYLYQGTATIFAPSVEYGYISPTVLTYSALDGYLYLGGMGFGYTISFKIIELKGDKLTVQYSENAPERQTFTYFTDNPEKYDDYEGIAIYMVPPFADYYYIDNGVSYECFPVYGTPDFLGTNLDGIVGFYDTIRISFKAE